MSEAKTYLAYSATFSVEDNKLRLYFARRLDAETYQRVKDMGFVWAPKQELFVAPSWTPQREDFCIEMAGEIEPEGTTLAERAEAKSDRLAGLSSKRAYEANAFFERANNISQRFYMGQPILVGHHSERKARKDQERMHNAMDASVEASKAAGYWQYRASGVVRHANRHHKPAVRINRIERLLKELRDIQRDINHGFKVMALWTDIANIEDANKKHEMVKYYSGAQLNTGAAAPWGTWSKRDKGELTDQEVIDLAFENGQVIVNSENRKRWIVHLLNRLAYERSELGEVQRFEGNITAAILQTFARTQGADKPTAKKQGDLWELSSDIPLPLHIGDGETLVLSTDEWRDLMQNVGYEVPAKKAALPPILNFKAEQITSAQRWNKGVEKFAQIEMTSDDYQKVRDEMRGVRVSVCGQFRFRVVHQRVDGKPYYHTETKAVFLTDSKTHPIPAAQAAEAVEA